MRILRRSDIVERTGLSGEHIRRLMRDGLFPQKFKLVPGTGRNGAVGWLESEVDEWINERAKGRDAADTELP